MPRPDPDRIVFDLERTFMLVKGRRFVSALLFLLIGGLTLFSETQVTAQKVGDQKSAVVFCVASYGAAEQAIEPILIIDSGKWSNPVAGDSDASDLTEFGSKYYGSGQKYRLLFGGADAGVVTVNKATSDSECFRTGALVKVSARPAIKLNRNVMALATNSNSLGKVKSSRRAPTAAERAEAIRLAKKKYGAKGTPAAALSTLEVVNLTSMDLDMDGKAEMIGTFVVKKTGKGAARYVLFMIAEMQDQNYRATLSNYEQFTSKDIMSGGSLDSVGSDGIYTERLVDQLDVDSDGTGEVISTTNGFEGVTFKIYSRKAGTWQSVYEFASYRCAF